MKSSASTIITRILKSCHHRNNQQTKTENFQNVVGRYARAKVTTLRSQIEGYTRLLIFRKISILPAVIWASLFINFQENFQPPCFFTYTNEIFSTLPTVIRAYPFINSQENFQPLCFFSYTNEIFSIPPAVIRAYPLIRFEEKFQPTLLLEPPLVLET